MDTLNTFFNPEKGSPEWVNGIVQSQEFKKTKQIIAQELTGFELSTPFFEKLILKLCETLDIPIGHVLVGGWRKYREIVQYRDKENPPSGYHEVTLVEHTVTSKHAPTITIRPIINGVPIINEVSLVKLQFDITLQLTLTGGILFIRDGMIMKATTGACTGSGKIEYKGHKLYEKKTQAYQLPGELIFDPGIAI